MNYFNVNYFDDVLRTFLFTPTVGDGKMYKFYNDETHDIVPKKSFIEKEIKKYEELILHNEEKIAELREKISQYKKQLKE